MKHMLRMFLYGFLTWLAPFVASIFFYSKYGQPLVDVFLLKSLMIVLGSAFGAFLLILYLRRVEDKLLKAGILVGVVWFGINCLLDIAVLIPMAGMDLGTWFAQIGLRYLVIPVMSISMAYFASQHKAA